MGRAHDILGDVGDDDTKRLHAHEIPQAVRFLRKDLKVRAMHIASVLGETPENIRQLTRRTRAYGAAEQPLALEEDDIELLDLNDAQRGAEAKRRTQGVRIRTKHDLDLTERDVWAIFQNHQAVGLKEGYDALLLVRPCVAHARHADALRVRLLIEEKLAWFAQALGDTQQAFIYARAAMSLALDAFRESGGEKQYLLRYGEAALVASICLQKMHLPALAFPYVRAADEANEAVGQKPGSEHLRQRGAIHLQMGDRYDQDARSEFDRARERMKQKEEANHPVDLKMTSLRQKALIDPGIHWDDAQEMLAEVAQTYGQKSLQYETAARFVAAVGLKFASSESNQTALELLDSISPVPASGLGSGVPHILSMTPGLGLKGGDLDRWLRFALWETPPSRK